MPIKPENRARYASDWEAIRRRIIERAHGACELCFVENGETYYRDALGFPWATEGAAAPGSTRPVQIVLTIAHINQQPEDNRDVNLLALCQRCHNRIDAPYRQENAAATRAARKAAASEDGGR